MGSYILKRLVSAAVMLILVSILIFGVLRLLPGDPTIAKLAGARGIDPQAVAELKRSLGLDRPLYWQYLRWMGGAAHGDFGKSYFSQYSVAELISQRLGATLELAVASLLVAVALALVLAVTPVIRDSAWLARMVTGYTVFGLSAPPFLIGIAIQLLFGNWLGWLPHYTYVGLGDDPARNLRLLAAPALTLGVAVSAPLINYLRASFHDVEGAAYVRTAYGSGVRRRRAVLAHIMPNALLPALTAVGVSVGALLGGVVQVEYVFGWPGLGSAIVSAVATRDYAVIQSMVLIVAAAYVLTNFAVDALYGVLDPRLRLATAKGAS